MSNLFDLDEENDELFKPSQEKQKPRRDLDDLFGTGSNTSTKSDTLDDILAPNVEEDLFKSAAANSKAASDDDLDALLNAQTSDGKGIGKAKKTKKVNKAVKNDDDLFGSGLVEDDIFSTMDNEQNKSSEVKVLVTEPSEKLSSMSSTRVRADSLDMLLDDQPTNMDPGSDNLVPVIEPDVKPKERKSVQRKPSKLKRKSRLVNTDKLGANEEPSSLDDMLNAQPDETVSTTDNKNIVLDTSTESSKNQVNINSMEPNVKNITETNDKDVPVADDGVLTSMKQELFDEGPDKMLDAQPIDMGPPSDDLDKIVTHSELKQETKHADEVQTLPDKVTELPNDDILTEITPAKPTDLSEDNLDTLLDSQPGSIEPSVKPKERKGLQRKPSKLKRKSKIVKTERFGTDEEPSSLDDMLNAQPDGTVSVSDELSSTTAKLSENQVNVSSLEPNVKTAMKETNDMKKPVEDLGISTNVKQELPDDSLDKMLDGQPDDMVSPSDDIDKIVTHSEIKQETKSAEKSEPSLDKTTELLNDTTLTKMLPTKPTDPSEDNLDTLLDSQPESTAKPKERKGLQRKPSKLKRKSRIVKTEKLGTDEEPSSLDVMLNAQPDGTVSISDDLSSTTDNKHIVQDAPAESSEIQVNIYSTETYDKAATQVMNNKEEPEEDLRISTKVKQELSDDSLDKMLDVQPDDMVSPSDDIDKIVTCSEIKQDTKSAEKSEPSPDKTTDLLNDTTLTEMLPTKPTDPSEDNLDTLLDSQLESQESTAKPKERKGLQRKPSKLKRKSRIVKTEKLGTAEEPTSLDDMLNAQPDGTVSVSDDLSSTTDNKIIVQDAPAESTEIQVNICSTETYDKAATQETNDKEEPVGDLGKSTNIKQEISDESPDKMIDTQPELESTNDDIDKIVTLSEMKQETNSAEKTEPLPDKATELLNDNNLTEMLPTKPTDQSEDNLDMLLDSQPESKESTAKPKERKGLQRKPSKLKRKSKIVKTEKLGTDKEPSSLDDMLNAQPDGTVSVSDDLSSTTDNKNIVNICSTETYVKAATQETNDKEEPVEDLGISINIKQVLSNDSPDKMKVTQPELESTSDDIDKIVTLNEIKQETKPADKSQTLPDNATELLNDTTLTQMSPAKPTDTSEENLDMLLDAQPEDVVPFNDDIHTLTVSDDTSSIEPNVQPRERKRVQRKPSKLKRKSRIINTEASDTNKELENLDDMLCAQPDGMVSVSDDLSSMVVNSDIPLDRKPELSDNAASGAIVDSVSVDTKDNDKVLDDKDIHNVDDDMSNNMKQNVSEESLDKMLHGQPVGTLSPSEDIQSLVAPTKKQKQVSEPPVKPHGEISKVSKSVNVTADQTVISKPEQSSSTDALSGETDRKDSVGKLHGTSMDQPEDNLDTLLDEQPDSIVPSNDDLHSLIMKNDTPSIESDVKLRKKPSLRRKPSKLNRKSRNIVVNKTESSKEEDNLDAMLDAQPDGMLPATDDLLSLVEPITNNATSSNTNATTESISQASPTKDTDLVDDLFGKSDSNLIDDFDFADEDSDVDTGTGDKAEVDDKCDSDTEDRQPVEAEDREPVETVPRKTNLKKTNMERSFEDLLNGLSDESDPELEDIIPDDIDNTNLERRVKHKSLLGTPDKSYRDIRGDTSEFTSKHIDDPFDMDVLSSTPNVRQPAESAQTKVTPPNVSPPEVRLHTPEDEEEDFDISGDRDDTDANVVEDVEMRPTRKSTLSSGDDVDLEVIEDTNHLDVDVSKHKSALGKKGSLALRRKPSRKSRKSLLSTGEDAIFQDSTDAKPEMMNGDDDVDAMFDNKDDDDDEGYDLSPPAKKPSPATMMPLPGLAGRPPSQRLSSSKAEDEEDTKEVKRKSKPPPGAFVLPPMGASPKKPLRPSSESSEKSPRESKSSTFEKPALKSVKPTDRSRSPVRDATPAYSRGGLRSKDISDVEMKSASEERDVTFQKPSLRSTPKPTRDRTPEQSMDTNDGIFEKPALRNTPKPKLEQKPIQPLEQEDVFATKNLRSVPKPDNFTKDITSEKHVFDKPQLKTPDNNKNDSKYREKTFEKPTLRSTNKNLRSESTEDPGYEPSGMFEKPALRTAGGRTTATNKEDNFTTGIFEKPSLKKTTPSPEKEVKDLNEPKGTFDRPPLRKTDSLKEREEKARTADRPSWLQKASDKHGRALDVLQAKENQSNSEKQVPSWLEKSPLRKNKGLPLQDTSNNQSTSSSQSDLSTEDYVKSTSSTPRSRNSSQGTENEPDRKASLPGPNNHNNYTPGWMRQARSPSVPSTGVISPAKSMPALNESNEIPQWKRELAQRRQNRKEKISEDVPKKVDNAEPEWKKGIMLRKTRNTAQPSKETHSVEPEWKKAAEEKRQRLRSKSLQYSHLKLT